MKQRTLGELTVSAIGLGVYGRFYSVFSPDSRSLNYQLNFTVNVLSSSFGDAALLFGGQESKLTGATAYGNNMNASIH